MSHVNIKNTETTAFFNGLLGLSVEGEENSQRCHASLECYNPADERDAFSHRLAQLRSMTAFVFRHLLNGVLHRLPDTDSGELSSICRLSTQATTV